MLLEATDGLGPTNLWQGCPQTPTLFADQFFVWPENTTARRFFRLRSLDNAAPPPLTIQRFLSAVAWPSGTGDYVLETARQWVLEQRLATLVPTGALGERPIPGGREPGRPVGLLSLARPAA